LHRPRQRELACVAGAPSFLVLDDVFQLVEADAVLVACTGHHTADDAPWRQPDSGYAGIERQHLRGHPVEIVHETPALVHQRSNGIGSRQGPFNAPLQRLCVVCRQIGRQCAAFGFLLLRRMAQPERDHDQAARKHQQRKQPLTLTNGRNGHGRECVVTTGMQPLSPIPGACACVGEPLRPPVSSMQRPQTHGQGAVKPGWICRNSK
jgi:hypothetical protein